jgi:hypothetical protein
VLRLGRESYFSLLFVALSLGASFYISVAALNYNQLYPSIDQLEFRIAAVHLTVPTSPLRPSLDTTVELMNPSSYNGFTVSQIILDFSQFSNSSAKLSLFLSYSQRVNTPLPSHSSSNVTVPAEITTAEASDLQSFSSASTGSPVTGQVRLTVQVSSFLDSITGPIPIVEMQNVTLT